MSQEEIGKQLSHVLSQVIDKIFVIFTPLIGAAIVFFDSYHTKKQSLIDSAFVFIFSYLVGLGVGLAVSYFTTSVGVMLTASLISCLGHKSIIQYFMTKTGTHIDTIVKGVVKRLTPKK